MRGISLAFLLAALAACGAELEPAVRAESGCKAIYDRLMRYVTANQRYPVTDEEWAPFESEKDPWGHAYQVDEQGDRVRVCSAGPDGKPATADDICFPSLE